MADTEQSAKKRPVGRPVEVDGKRVQVYLDEDSLKTAFRLGGGNVSRGIRAALLLCDKNLIVR